MRVIRSGVCERLDLRKVTMARQKTLQCTFKCIDREEMHVHVKHEFESLGRRLELDSSECHFVLL